MDFLFLMDQSSGHGRMRDAALNANNMSIRFGGKQGMLRKTRLRDIGPYQKILSIGNKQSMIFEDGDQGPFYLKLEDQVCRKYDQFKGRMKIIKKTKRQLMDELKTREFSIRKYYSREEIEKLAQKYKIDLTYGQKEIIEGWVCKPKGLLQVIWERGWINTEELNKYSGDGKSCQKDEFGKVTKENKRFVLRTLMLKTLDFTREQSAMTYNAYNSNQDPLTYKAIKRFVKMVKCHRNIANQDKAFIERAWKEAQMNSVEN